MNCETAFNAINGRFCRKLNSYVEYAKEPPCRKVEANQKHEYSTISDNEMFLDGSLLDMIRNA